MKYSSNCDIFQSITGVVSCQFCNKNTVLHLAVDKGNIEMIKLLLKQKSINLNAVDEI